VGPRDGFDRTGASLTKLAQVAQHRAPYRALLERIVARVLERSPFAGNGPVVEIGAGDGQLRPLLPAALLPRVVHTEPSEAGRRAFAARFPEAVLVAGTATDLPRQWQPLAGVMGLCTLDIVGSLDGVAQAMARAITPGGRLVHLLDLNVEVSDAFAMIHQHALVPLPNVFTDPLMSGLPDDLFVVPLAQLAMMVEILRRAGSSLERALRAYVDLNQAQGWNLGRAVAGYHQLNEHPENLARLRATLRTIRRLATNDEAALLAQFQGRPLSSARFFAARLAQAFSQGAGFEVERCEVVTAHQRVGHAPGAPRYRALCVGTVRESDRPPARYLDAPSEPLAEGEALVEIGVLAFVARRR
jgi:hypothetical protein